MLLPIRYPERPKKQGYDDLFSGELGGKKGKLSPFLFPVESDGFVVVIWEQIFDMR